VNRVRQGVSRQAEGVQRLSLVQLRSRTQHRHRMGGRIPRRQPVAEAEGARNISKKEPRSRSAGKSQTVKSAGELGTKAHVQAWALVRSED
jgi:hypothetical protein